MVDSVKIDRIEIAKLEIEPGDVLVLRVPPEWTPDHQRAAHRALQEVLAAAGLSPPIVLAPTTVDIQIVRKASA